MTSELADYQALVKSSYKGTVLGMRAFLCSSLYCGPPFLLVSLPSPSFLPLEIGVSLCLMCISMLAWASFSLSVSDALSCLFLGRRHTAECWGSDQWASGKSQADTGNAKISQGALRRTKGASSQGRQRGPSEGRHLK